MLKKLSEKLGAKFPATTAGCSIVKIARLDDAFLEAFRPQGSPIEIQSLQRTEKKRRKRKGEKNISKIEKPKEVDHFLLQKLQNFDFSACPSQNVIKRDGSGKNGELSCCKCIIDQIKANFGGIQPENRQNVQKARFLQKAPGVNGLTNIRLPTQFIQRKSLTKVTVVIFKTIFRRTTP